MKTQEPLEADGLRDFPRFKEWLEKQPDDEVFAFHYVLREAGTGVPCENFEVIQNALADAGLHTSFRGMDFYGNLKAIAAFNEKVKQKAKQMGLTEVKS